MALNLPSTAKEISQKAKIDVKRELTQSDPFLARSYLGAIISGISNRVFEFYYALTEAEAEANPFTAVRNLVRWASVWGVTRLAGQTASGSIFIDSSQTGTGTTIPINTQLQSSDGLIYSTQSAATLAAGSIAVSGQISHVSGVATVTTGSAHNLASNALVTITGATEAGYNLVDAVITVTSATTFTYEVNSATTSPSTGTPLVNYEGVTVDVNAAASGTLSNATADAELSFVSPISGVETSARVTFGGIIDGISVESDADLRARLLDRIQNPVTPFNVANIRATAREVAGVTRVFVQEKTPAIGQVTVYFMRDNDTDPIPSPTDVNTTKAKILTIKPAAISDTDVIVAAPTGEETDFTFSALSPDTATMRTAIQASLADYFDQTPSVGVDVAQDAYRSVIFNTVDPADGSRVTSFTLSGPTILVNAQDETSYDNSPTTEGAFTGGGGHAVSDVITMSDGSTVLVDAETAGAVTQFTVTSTNSRGAVAGGTISQASTTGSGIGFFLFPDADNLTPIGDLKVGSDGIRTLGTVTFP